MNSNSDDARAKSTGKVKRPKLFFVAGVLIIPFLCYVIGRPICWAYYYCASNRDVPWSPFFWGSGPHGGSSPDDESIIFAIVMNIVLCLAVYFTSVQSLKVLIALSKERDVKSEVTVAFCSACVSCGLLYLPIFDGRSLAPTFAFMPYTRWTEMAGCLIVPALLTLRIYENYVLDFLGLRGYTCPRCGGSAGTSAPLIGNDVFAIALYSFAMIFAGNSCEKCGGIPFGEFPVSTRMVITARKVRWLIFFLIVAGVIVGIIAAVSLSNRR